MAGTCTSQDLESADRSFVELLRRFTPHIRRGSHQLSQGIYFLDVRGLTLAFGSLKAWARKLLDSLWQQGWEARLVLGFTPFATEIASFRCTASQPFYVFRDRASEERITLDTSLSEFSLSPEQVRRLNRFSVCTLQDFLALEPQELRHRFGADVMEFYNKAVEAIFSKFELIPEDVSLESDMGFVHPVSDLTTLLECVRKLLSGLLPRLISREEGVSVACLRLILEGGKEQIHRLHPSFPTVDRNWLMTLFRLRLERYFQQYPLRWGGRVERVGLQLRGEPDPEKQGDLFSGWALAVDTDESLSLIPRDREAALWALGRLRAEFGEEALVRAKVSSHHLPGRNYSWHCERESMECLGQACLRTESASSRTLRSRRVLTRCLRLSRKDRWPDKEGPFLLSGDWWGQAFSRQYFFARVKSQLAWIYWDDERLAWYAQGWLQ